MDQVSELFLQRVPISLRGKWGKNNSSPSRVYFCTREREWRKRTKAHKEEREERK